MFVVAFADFFRFVGLRHKPETSGKPTRAEAVEAERRTALKRLMVFCQIYQSMSPSAIIAELENLHRNCGVIQWWPEVVDAAAHLRDSELNIEEVERMLQMLLWDEFRGYRDRTAPFCLLRAAVMRPSSY